MKYKKEPSHNHKSTQNNTGVLLVNLGTPSALDYFSIRRYLKEFLSDPRVVEGNRIKWWFILNVILLSFIPFRSAKKYREIWNNDKNESPLLSITRSQAQKLHTLYKDKNVIIEFAMRYGNPSIKSKINVLKQQGCKKIVIFPLYPQYSAVTTASVLDATFSALKKIRWIPTIKTAKPYYKHKNYIEALALSVKQHMKDKELKIKETLILCSYHGIPQKYFENGDPYPLQCIETTELLCQQLKLDGSQIKTVYQSRFGRDEWVKPYLEATLKELPSQRIKQVVVISPSFASDCVETLEELSIDSKETFIAAGGENFSVVPCLNDSKEGIEMLKVIIDEELKSI